jgi:protein-S-isoprenylcysteine O-methyltransferase Ste14
MLMFNRLAAFMYGVISYLVFFASFLYAIGFLINIGVPKGIDAGRQTSLLYAIAVNCGLLTLFAVQHSVMARPWFKRAWTKFVPEPIERSTYVLFSSIAMILLFWKWEPIGGVIWSIEQPGARYLVLGFYALGWAILLLATFLINHFDLFGLRQVWLYLLGKPYTQLQFNTPLLYKYVRHPLYVGWLMIFWSAPVMTSAHLLFAVATTAYILLAIQWEEHDLIQMHPEYAEYRRRVPMLIPGTGKKDEADMGLASPAAQ